MKPHAIAVVALALICSIAPHQARATSTQPVAKECDKQECDIDVRAVVSGGTCKVQLFWQNTPFDVLDVKRGNHDVLLKWQLDNDTKKDWYFAFPDASVSLPSTGQFHSHENYLKHYHVRDDNTDTNPYPYTVRLRNLLWPFIGDCVSDPTIANHG
jgi:hypothetical protein